MPKTKIAILSSFWHGGYDGTQVENYYPDVKIISSSGITENHIDELILLPNNDNKKCFEILIKNKDDIAMVFCEPVQQIVPHINIELLKELRKFTKENKILFGFDEMITGFRLALGGAQEYLNIYSDIACYGKIIGGGYPIGIIAINKEINDHIETVQPSIRFGGTFSGNPLSTYTGNLVLNYLIENKSDIYAKINNLTKRLCDKINEFSQVNNFSIQFCYVGSFYRIIFTDKNITSMEERKKYELNNIKQKQFYNILIENNLITAANPLSFISYKHTESDIDRISEIYKKSIINFFQ